MELRGTIEVCGPVVPGDCVDLVARAEQLLQDGSVPELVCEVTGRMDLSVVDCLARLQLVARRHKVLLRVVIQSSEEELSSLLTYLGLAEAIAREG